MHECHDHTQSEFGPRAVKIWRRAGRLHGRKFSYATLQKITSIYFPVIVHWFNAATVCKCRIVTWQLRAARQDSHVDGPFTNLMCVQGLRLPRRQLFSEATSFWARVFSRSSTLRIPCANPKHSLHLEREVYART